MGRQPLDSSALSGDARGDELSGDAPVDQIQAVIFDLDGVLVDSECAWDAARKEVALSHGGRWPADAQRTMMGMSSTEWSAYMHDELGVALEPEQLSEAVVSRLRDVYAEHLPLIPGAREAVSVLAEVWPLGLASSSNRSVIELVLDGAEMRRLISVIVSSEEVPRGKPAPDVYLEAARRLDASPTRCVAIEDSSNGLRSAAAAGMRVIAIPNRDVPPDDDALALADEVLDSLAQLNPGCVERVGVSAGADLRLALELADLAGRIALERFRSRDYRVGIKSDGSPVTAVDREVESALRERLAQERPHHEIFGEELGRRGSSECRWYLDPIDGTRRFIAGDPKWMTLIALAIRERVVVGVVALPALGERWWARRGKGAFHDGNPVRVSNTTRLADAAVSDDWRHSLARGATNTPLATIAARCACVRPHQGHGFLRLAAGEVDVAVQVGSAPWDYAPLKVIVEEAGGRFTDFAGGERIDTGRVVGTNGRIHAEVLELLESVGA